MIVQTRSAYDQQADHLFRPAKESLPTMYDLPSENPEEPGVPDQFHILQPEVLTQTFCPPGYSSKQMMTASDLNLYYDMRSPGSYKRPDWYAVLGVPYFYREQELRPSYVIWQEKVVPFIVVELLSPGTEKEDLGKAPRKSEEIPTKWEVYEQILGIPYYVLYNRHKDELLAFELTGGKYDRIDIPDKRVWLPEISLGLGLRTGTCMELKRDWLRWYDADGNWIPTPAERAEQEKQRAENAEQRAEQEKLQKEKLLAQLKALGIKPDL